MKRMLFNATQAEELRVAIVDGQKLIDLDIESAAKEQRKSNIYKAVITRIEPSLEAAFVDYGAERHGFLPFKEVSRSFFLPGVEAGRARIQDALKVGQELIVQVEKDERGNKGAALTTYISLAGRYLVLMPNNPRGGGVSRRIEGEERQELREVMDQLDIPGGMSLIARTAGIGRSAEELQWDLNYLLQLWNAIDGAAKAQSGAFLIYQESSLVIRAIRDYFQPEIGEILIDTDDIFEQAQQFMSHVMPGNVARVKRYHDDVPLFSRFQIEHQIESAYSRQVNLPSGGAVVIDHTEALVAVDVNSGRATKGADIEETALRTNLEAADEIARQLRLRDLGGLIVIDFIDMESSKSQREVENRLRDALHFDRARVQTGKISRFGLLELSRQRLRPALAETSYITCPRCTGTGHIRSTESAALHILRILEEEAMKENTGAIHVQVPVDVATFLLNEKRVDIARIELRHHATMLIIPNRHLETPQHEIIRLRHDQLNQDGPVLASYEMAVKPAEDNLATQAEAKAEAKAARPEAAVKGITPDRPAPISQPAQPAPEPQKPGFFARILSWFSSEPAAETPAETTPKKTEKNPRRNDRGDRDRNDRGGRKGREGREGRDGREPRDNRNENRNENRPPRDRTTESANPADPVESSEQRKEPRAPRERDNRPGRKEPREPREPRGDTRDTRREGRENRDSRGETPAGPGEEAANLAVIAAPVAATIPAATLATTADAAADTTAAGANTNPATAANGDSTDNNRDGDNRRRGRRGGRGRGDRRNEESASPAQPQPSDSPADAVPPAPTFAETAPVAVAAAVATEPQQSRPETQPAPWPTTLAVAPAPADTQAPQQAPQSLPTTAVVTQPAQASSATPATPAATATVSEVAGVTAVTEVATKAVLAEPAAVTAATEVTAVTAIAAMPATVAAPAPLSPSQPGPDITATPAPQDTPTPAADLSLELEKAGLQLVETASTTKPAMPIDAPARPLGRKPKAPVTLTAEPLQMVETQQPQQPTTTS